jgi:hypothetical protein
MQGFFVPLFSYCCFISMNKHLVYLSLLAGLWSSLPVSAQNYTDDALLYSRYGVNGSARIQGLGGAQQALGGDISSLSGNPAGLGLFRKSEWSLTAGARLGYTQSAYLGVQTPDNKFNVSLPNFGIVFSGAKDDLVEGKWRGGNFGISFNQQQTLHSQYSFSGTNNNNSFLDYLVSEAKGLDARNLYNDFQQVPGTSIYELTSRPAAAYTLFLINPILGSNGRNTTNYYRFNDGNDPADPFSSVRQSGTISSSGASSQWNLGYGGNYGDFLYFGASLGISRLRYDVKSDYREDFLIDPANRNINFFTYSEDKQVRGTGVNLKAGLILRPADFIRIGVSAVTPTYMSIKETFQSRFTANYPNLSFDTYSYEPAQGGGDTGLVQAKLSDVNGYTAQTVPNDFNYDLITPAQFSAGTALFLGKIGFLTADVDYVAYKGLQISGGNAAFRTDINRQLEQSVDNVINYRAGAELRLDIFRIRAGAAYFSDPTPNNNLDDTRISYTAGVGLRLDSFYLDLGAVHSRYKSAYTPYALSTAPSAVVEQRPTQVLISFGAYF